MNQVHSTMWREQDSLIRLCWVRRVNAILDRHSRTWTTLISRTPIWTIYREVLVRWIRIYSLRTMNSRSVIVIWIIVILIVYLKTRIIRHSIMSHRIHRNWNNCKRRRINMWITLINLIYRTTISSSTFRTTWICRTYFIMKCINNNNWCQMPVRTYSTNTMNMNWTIWKWFRT